MPVIIPTGGLGFSPLKYAQFFMPRVVAVPVHMEWVEAPSEQDWIDLEKLYKEVPDHWLSSGDSAQAYTQAKQEAGYKLVAGRFNDRLISAAALKPEGQNQYLIEDVCVRQVTQNRGVAKQLLVRICQWADGQGEALMVNDPEQKYGQLAELGFENQDGSWLRSAQ